MFNSEKNNSSQALSTSMISRDTIIEGNITTECNLRIEGRIIGDIFTKSKIVTGEGSSVKGNIKAQNAEIAGAMEGTINIKELLIFKPTASFDGNIQTNKLIFEQGAIFNGNCTMETNSNVRKNKNERKDKIKITEEVI